MVMEKIDSRQNSINRSGAGGQATPNGPGADSDSPLTPYNFFSYPGGYSVDGHLTSMPISFLVDTRAAVTLVEKETWYRIGVKTELKPCGGKAVCQCSRNPIGLAAVEIVLESTPFVNVVSPLTTPAIILGAGRKSISVGAV